MVPEKAETASKGGLIEGISRGASQACVYVLEFQKTQLQIYGRIPHYSHVEWLQHLSRGLVSSAFTAGMVYGTYFSVYNHIPDKVLAGMAATVATSVMKIPIANSMRVLQSGGYPHVLAAAARIYKTHGLRGIYSGYGLSLIDDYLDMECRIRIYNYLRTLVPEGRIDHTAGLIMGAISGSLAAGLTTPFDAVRCNMAFSSSQRGTGTVCTLRTIREMWKAGGPAMFVRGVGYRTGSNAVRSALFCMFYEFLLSQQQKKQKLC